MVQPNEAASLSFSFFNPLYYFQLCSQTYCFAHFVWFTNTHHNHFLLLRSHVGHK
jgi:hypothetical protein